MSVICGSYRHRAWDASELQSAYREVFKSRVRARAMRVLNRLQARRFSREPAGTMRSVEEVGRPSTFQFSAKVASRREQCNRLLGEGGDQSTDLVGMGRPFYAESRLPARFFGDGKQVLCDSCNNCTVPQAAGEPGRCRTPRN